MNIELFQKLANIVGESSEDTASLRHMADEARAYITSFKWCPEIREMYLAHGVADIVAIFLVEFAAKIQRTDQKLWVVVGDLPSAYLVVEVNDSVREALRRYCDLMDDWAGAVENHGLLDDVFPVDTKPTRENAYGLRTRMELLRSEVIPMAPA